VVMCEKLPAYWRSLLFTELPGRGVLGSSA
jgi:hypothetical protein